jgi:hypothetical protein
MKEFLPRQERAVVIVDDAMYVAILRRQRQMGGFLRYEMRRSSDLRARFEPSYYAECLRTFAVLPAHAELLKPYLLSVLDKDVNDNTLSEWKRMATHLLEKGILRRPKPLPLDRPVECWNDPDVEIGIIPCATHHVWEERLETPWKRLIARDEQTQLRYAVQLAAAWLEEGVSPDRIVIANAMPDDRFFLQTLAKRYGFVLSDDGRTPLIQLPSVSRLWQWMDTLDPTQAVQKAFEDSDDPIQSEIRDIIDLYDGFPEAKRWIRFELERRMATMPIATRGVKLATFSELSVLEDAKIIVLNAYEGAFPPLVQDDGILSDRMKPWLGLPTSIEENTIRRRKLARIVESLDEIVLIVPAKVKGNPTVEIDPALFLRPCRTIQPSEDWLERSRSDARFLFGSLTHDARIYGVRSSLLERLQASFSAIQAYDPRFRGVDAATNHRLLKAPTSLSATSLETFFSCRFRYLLTHMLKMEPKFDSLSANLGTAVHHRLERMDDPVCEPISLSSKSLGKARLRTFEMATTRRLDRIVSRLMEHANQTQFHDVAKEQSVQISIEGTTKFVLKGRIDRVMAHRLDNQDYLVVIDYKTGNAQFDEESFQQGMDLQLIVYLELLRKLPDFGQAKIAGFFIQPIPLGRLAEVDGSDDLADRMKMRGYLLDRTDLAKAFDPGGYVRGMAFKNDGTFHSRAKVIDADQFDVWLNRLQVHLQTAIQQIEDGDYRITPISKMPGETESVSCQYCPFANICYSANRNLEETEESIERGEDDPWQD